MTASMKMAFTDLRQDQGLLITIVWYPCTRIWLGFCDQQNVADGMSLLS